MALHSKYTRALTFENLCQEARRHAEEENARMQREAEQLAKEEEERKQMEAEEEEEEPGTSPVLAKSRESLPTQHNDCLQSGREVVTEWKREVREWMKDDNSSTQLLSTRPLSPLPFFSPWGASASPPPPHAISLSSALPFSLSPSPTRSALSGCPPNFSSPSTFSPANVYSNTLNANPGRNSKKSHFWFTNIANKLGS
jgi:hypothetical protein